MPAAVQEKKKRKGLLPGLLRLLVIIAVLDLSLLAVLWFRGKHAAPDWEMGTNREEVLDKLEETGQAAESETDYLPLLQDPENYPEALLELAGKNPEALQFVLDYPEKWDDPPAETIQELQEGEIPHLFQWDPRWGYFVYGDHVLGVTGCGPTCLSMVASGLLQDPSLTPAVVAEWSQKNGHYVSGSGSSWSLMTEGAAHFGLEARELPLDEGTMKAALEQGNPIILSVREGDFTTSGHFIVLYGVKDGLFQVYDPNSQALSDKLWDYETLSPQIRNLWSFQVAGEEPDTAEILIT